MIENIGGMDIYYEKVGEGRPLLMLHGNGEDHGIFVSAAEKFAREGFAVYLPDTRGHGQSGSVDSLHYGDMAGDVAGLISRLGLEQPALLGFSDGGIVGLILAIAHPRLLSSLICCGANVHPSGLGVWFRALMRLSYTFNRDDKLRLMLEQPDINDSQLASITCPTLVMAGEKDIIAERHTRHIQSCIPGSEMRILPGQNHDSYIKNDDLLLEHALPFLMAQQQA